MKQFAALLLTAIATSALHAADVEIDKKTADSIKSFSTHQFNEKTATLEDGQIVRLKFAYRSEIHDSRGEARCQVRDAKGAGSSGIAGAADSAINYVVILVPAEGVAWLNRVPTDHKSGNTLTAIGRVVKDKRGSCEVRLLGRDIQSDFKGAKIVWPK